MFCRNDADLLGYLYNFFFFFLGLASAYLFQKCISKDKKHKNSYQVTRRWQNQKDSRKLTQSQHLFKSPRGWKFIFSRLSLFPLLRAALRMEYNNLFSNLTHQYKLSQPVGEAAPFKKLFWSFFCSGVKQISLVEGLLFYFRKGKSGFFATNKSTDHVPQQMYVWFFGV